MGNGSRLKPGFDPDATFLETPTVRRNEIAQIRRNIEVDDIQMQQDGGICSQYAGRVAEVMVAAGQVMPAGGRLQAERSPDSKGTPYHYIVYWNVNYFLVVESKGRLPRTAVRNRASASSMRRSKYDLPRLCRLHVIRDSSFSAFRKLNAPRRIASGKSQRNWPNTTHAADADCAPAIPGRPQGLLKPPEFVGCLTQSGM